MASRVHVVNVAQMLQRFRAEQFLCDTVLTTRDGELRAHSLILASVSAVFRAAFQNSESPGMHHISLPNVDTETLNIALHFMYTGTLHLPCTYRSEANRLESLFATLEDLGLDGVKLSRCEITFNSDDEDSDGDEYSDRAILTVDDGSEVVERENWAENNNSPEMALASNDNTITLPVDIQTTQIRDHRSNEQQDNHLGLMRDPSYTNQSEILASSAVSDSLKTTSLVESNLQELKQQFCLTSSLPAAGGYERLNDFSVPVERINFTCRTCGVTCLGLRKYLRHRARAHNNAHLNIWRKPYGCTQCGRRFSQRFSLLRHGHLHTGVRQHLCQICGKNFIQKISLENHVKKTHHPTDTPYNDSVSLGNDMSPNVTEMVPPQLFTCDVCAKSFTRAAALANHAKVHRTVRTYACNGSTGEKSYSCRVCSKSFSQRGALAQHERTHTGARPFSCTTCGKTFTVRVMLKQHENIHTGERPHVCATCGKAFAYRESLIVHTRIHTGIKPFTCSVCGSIYTQSHHLKGHMLTHTGEKPFNCNYCDKSYKNRVDLRFHCARVHQINISKRDNLTSGTILK